MPFVYDEENVEWPENAGDDYEPPPPAPADFEYFAPPDFGGAAEPVTFSDPSQGKRAKPPASSEPYLAKRGIVGWILGKVIPGVSDYRNRLRSQQQEMEHRRERLFEIMLPALRDIGGMRMHCDYDGGNDEGFAWFRSFETADKVWSLEEVCDRLIGSGLKEKLVAASLIHERPDNPRTERQHLEDLLKYSLPEEWACLLLGWGFGTGAFSMYGAFTVDLHECTITDDRDADVPEDGNILIGGGDD